MTTHRVFSFKFTNTLLTGLIACSALAACSQSSNNLKDGQPIYTLATPAPTTRPATVKNNLATEAHDEAEAPCEVAQEGGRRFLPVTTAPPEGRILPAQENDCAFYNLSWQSFLFATRNVSSKSGNKPAFLAYEPFEQVFGIQATPTFSKLALNDPSDSHEPPILNGGFRQAGEMAAILVDQNHNPIFYSIHINQTFADFVRTHKLNQLSNLLKLPGAGGIPADLEFPPGALELKAAWKIVEAHENPDDYYTMQARVPVLENQADEVVATGKTRTVRVALLSLHVVGVIEDHPEFIWATFEHADAQGNRNLAPAAKTHPGTSPQLIDQIAGHYPLYRPGTPASLANRLPDQQLIDAKTQKFPEATSVYRVFPASIQDQTEEDFAVTTLNDNIGKLFNSADPNQTDWRRNYRMVGANWLDDPASNQPNGDFKADRSFENAADPDAKLVMAGEDSLSSMAMESFTQTPGTTCLSCHNTLSKQVSRSVSLPPRRINVSNVLTFYARSVLEGK